MKRLVVCCDGTWNKPDNETITNVEKIARTVQSDPAATGGTSQLVYYVAGVGSNSYWADRILGGAFGFGLFGQVVAAYRFLAQNYEEGDEIFIVGFSRGAYTARSLAGMVAKVGLLTKLGLGAGGQAFDRGRRRLSNARALSVRVASSAVNHVQSGEYEPSNLAAYAEETHGFAGIVERVLALPENGLDLSELGRPPSAAP